MRPWLLLPVLLPGLWLGVTLSELWPPDAPAWLSHPLMCAVAAVTGIALAMLSERMRIAPRAIPREPWFQRKAKQDDAVPAQLQPLVSARTPMVEAWRTGALKELRVDMPEIITSTPAPSR